MTPEQRNELGEVFCFAYQSAGFDAAIEAVANAAVLSAAGLSSRARIAPVRIYLPAVRMACELYGIAPKPFLSSSKVKLLTDCRAVAALAMRLGGMSLQSITMAMGRRDHTAAMAAIKRAKASPLLQRQAEEIAATIAGTNQRTEERAA